MQKELFVIKNNAKKNTRQHSLVAELVSSRVGWQRVAILSLYLNLGKKSNGMLNKAKT